MTRPEVCHASLKTTKVMKVGSAEVGQIHRLTSKRTALSWKTKRGIPHIVRDFHQGIGFARYINYLHTWRSILKRDFQLAVLCHGRRWIQQRNIGFVLIQAGLILLVLFNDQKKASSLKPETALYYPAS